MRLAALGTLLLTGLGIGLAIAETTMYSVYCASGKIEVDSRTVVQMKAARSSVCQFGSFTSVSSAQDLAKKQFRGVGASCTCGN